MDKLDYNLKRLEAAIDNVSRAAHSARKHLGEHLQLTRTQLEILMMLALKPGQTTGELAGRLTLTQSAITQTVDTLFRRGFLERRSDEQDRRVIRLHLSATGLETTSQLRALKRERLRAVMARLTDAEVDAMITATEKFATVLEEKPNPAQH